MSLIWSSLYTYIVSVNSIINLRRTLGGKTICCIIVCSSSYKCVLTRKYYYSLNAQAKARYEEKLKLAGLSLEEDPYDERNANSYKDDMTAWPPLEYGHIFTYFIRHPAGIYTQEQLLSWKKLEAYNYFQNGYVRLVQVYRLNSGTCVLKSLVNPSQRSAASTGNPHNPWVIVNADGTVVTAHCTCMAE